MSVNKSNPRIKAIEEITSILNGNNRKSYNNEDAFYRSLISETMRRFGEINFYLKKYIKNLSKKIKNMLKLI